MLGLSPLAESVYFEMVTSPASRVDDLARTLDAGTDAIRAALDDLARLALVQESSTDGHLRAVRPDVGVSALLAREQAAIARRNQELEEGRVALAQLMERQSDTRRGPDVEVLDTVDEVRDRLVTLARECTEDWRTFVPTRSTTTSGLAGSRPLSDDLLRRGVRMRTVYLESVRNHPETWAHVMRLRDYGAEVRLAAAIPSRMHIVDDRYAVVPQWQAESGVGAVVLSAPGVVSALGALFQHVWRSANPL